MADKISEQYKHNVHAENPFHKSSHPPSNLSLHLFICIFINKNHRFPIEVRALERVLQSEDHHFANSLLLYLSHLQSSRFRNGPHEWFTQPCVQQAFS